MRLPRFIGLFLLSSLLAVTAAEASPGDRKLARQAAKHKQAGIAHLGRGQLEQAIDQLQIAYGLSKEAILLFHLGEAHNLLKEYTQALYYYRTYLERDPRGAERRGVAALIEALEALEEATQEEPEDEEDDLVDAGLAVAPDPLPSPRPMAAEPPALDRSRGRGLRISGVLTIGAGLGLSAASVYFAIEAKSRADEISSLFAQEAAWDRDYDAMYAKGRRARRNALLLGVGGAAAVLSGSALYYLGTKRRTPRVEVTPIAGGGLVSFACVY